MAFRSRSSLLLGHVVGLGAVGGLLAPAALAAHDESCTDEQAQVEPEQPSEPPQAVATAEPPATAVATPEGEVTEVAGSAPAAGGARRLVTPRLATDRSAVTDEQVAAIQRALQGQGPPPQPYGDRVWLTPEIAQHFGPEVEAGGWSAETTFTAGGVIYGHHLIPLTVQRAEVLERVPDLLPTQETSGSRPWGSRLPAAFDLISAAAAEHRPITRALLAHEMGERSGPVGQVVHRLETLGYVTYRRGGEIGVRPDAPPREDLVVRPPPARHGERIGQIIDLVGALPGLTATDVGALLGIPSSGPADAMRGLVNTGRLRRGARGFDPVEAREPSLAETKRALPPASPGRRVLDLTLGKRDLTWEEIAQETGVSPAAVAAIMRTFARHLVIPVGRVTSQQAPVTAGGRPTSRLPRSPWEVLAIAREILASEPGIGSRDLAKLLRVNSSMAIDFIDRLKSETVIPDPGGPDGFVVLADGRAFSRRAGVVTHVPAVPAGEAEASESGIPVSLVRTPAAALYLVDSETKQRVFSLDPVTQSLAAVPADLLDKVNTEIRGPQNILRYEPYPPGTKTYHLHRYRREEARRMLEENPQVSSVEVATTLGIKTKAAWELLQYAKARRGVPADPSVAPPAGPLDASDCGSDENRPA